MELSDVDLTAGDGMPGIKGVDGGAQASMAPGGSNGEIACQAPPKGGAQSAVNTCDDGMSNKQENAVRLIEKGALLEVISEDTFLRNI